MRIAVWHNLPSGGGKRALVDHVTGLLARGHQVESWCPDSADNEFLKLPGTEHRLPWPEPPNAKFLRFARQEAITIRSRMIRMSEHCRTVANQIRDGGFDVLFANSCQFFRVVPLADKVTIPAVLYVQEPARWLYEAMPEPPFAAPARSRRSIFAPWYMKNLLRDRYEIPAKRAQIRYEYEAAKNYRRILVNSLYSRESVLRAYGLNAHTCYLGIDTARFSRHPSPVKDNTYVVGLGAIVPEKNIEFILHATQGTKLIWIGNAANPWYRNHIIELAKSLGVNFDLRERITDDALQELLTSALALVYAPRLEPFGYAPLEANACGTPVIAVAEGGVRETVLHDVNGLLVQTPEEMSAAIDRLRDDSQLARRLGETGRELVRTNWSLNAAIDRLEAHLKAVAS